MDKTSSNYARFSNFLSLLTLLFLLGAISITLTQAVNRPHKNADVKGVRTQEKQKLAAAVVPSPNCLGGEPCTSPEPSEYIVPTSTSDGIPAQPDSGDNGDSPTSPNNPSEDPCATEQSSIQNVKNTKNRVKNYAQYISRLPNDVSIQVDQTRERKQDGTGDQDQTRERRQDGNGDQENRSNGNGQLSELLRMLIEFLEQLLSRLGVQNPNLNPNENQPTPGNNEEPCDPVSPTNAPEPTQEPEAQPTQTQGQNPTEQPQTTTIPAPTSESVNPTEAPAQPPVGGGNTGGGETRSVRVTFYGSYDNDPKGSLGISNPVIHQQAGGIGTYEDPLTFASPEGAGAYEIGQKIYVPYVQKYFIKEDTCAVSWTAPNGCGDVDMVDLYVGNPSSDVSVLECEGALTRDGDSTIIVNPPSNLTVDSTPIWNQNTKTCMTPHD